jgi:hypothetical protein
VESPCGDPKQLGGGESILIQANLSDAAVIFVAQSSTSPTTPGEQFWQKVVLAFIAGAIGFAASFALERYKARREPVERLSFEKDVRKGLVAVQPEMREKVNVTYNGTKIENLYAVSCIVENTGNRVVRKQYLKFTFPEGTNLLDSYFDPKPDREVGLKEAPQPEDLGTERRYFVEHLALGERIGFQFVASGEKVPDPGIRPRGEESDVQLAERAATRAADDSQQVQSFIKILVIYFLVASVIRTLTDGLGSFYGYLAGLVGAGINIVFLILLAPYVGPVARIIGGLIQRALSRDESRGNINVEYIKGDQVVLANSMEGRVDLEKTEMAEPVQRPLVEATPKQIEG